MDAERFAALLLIGGSICFLVGAFNPVLFSVWTAPTEMQLRLIAERAAAWSISNALFLGATVLTAAGLWLVPDLVGGSGAPVARAATVAYLLGAVAWVMSLAVRLAVAPKTASAFVSTHAVDPSYAGLSSLAGGLFVVFTFVAGASLVALGLSIVAGGSLPVIAGWFAAVMGGMMVVGYLAAGDMPPFVAYLPTGLLGIALLLMAT